VDRAVRRLTAVVWLRPDAARYITGAALPIDARDTAKKD
jgi:hypothetical protein